MAKYFLGSVGKAEAFRKTATGYELAFVSKTLTDSGLNISTTKDDIRGGQGAPIQFSFYHDPNVEITLTDVVWDHNYLTAQLGAEFKNNESQDYITKKVTFGAGVASRQGLPQIYKVPVPCDTTDSYIAWGTPVGKDEWINIHYNETDDQFEICKEDGSVDTNIEGDYCVRYLGRDDRAYQATINSLIIPEELFLIITAPIFAGDACGASRGKAAGHITFEVPRFLLNGAQEFAMNMSQNQTMSLAGIALATSAEDCDDQEGGKLLRVIEVIDDNKNWQDSVTGILVDGQYEVAGQAPVLYAEMKDGKIRKLKDEEVSVKIGSADYIDIPDNFEFAAGTTYRFKLKGTSIESEIITIPAA